MAEAKFYEPIILSNCWKGPIEDVLNPSRFRWHQQVKSLNLLEDSPLSLEGQVVLLGYSSEYENRRFAIKDEKDDRSLKNGEQNLQEVRKALSELYWHASTQKEMFTIYDAGNIVHHEPRSAKALEFLSECVQKIRVEQGFPLILGGTRESNFGVGRGVFQTLQESSQKIGFITVSSRLGLAESPAFKEEAFPHGENSLLCLADLAREEDRPFHAMALGVRKAQNQKASYLLADTLDLSYVALESWDLFDFRSLENFMTNVDQICLSISLDVFNESVACGVNQPNPIGLSLFQFYPVLQKILASEKVASLEITDYNFSRDRRGQTARLIAQLVFWITEALKNQ